jgi:hypothetical protein
VRGLSPSGSRRPKATGRTRTAAEGHQAPQLKTTSTTTTGTGTDGAIGEVKLSLGSWVAAPLYVVLCLAACFVAALPVCAYIAKKRGPEGLRAFAEVVRAFWGRKS